MFDRLMKHIPRSISCSTNNTFIRVKRTYSERRGYGVKYVTIRMVIRSSSVIFKRDNRINCCGI